MSALIYSSFEMRSVIMLPTPVFWPGEFHGPYGPWVHKESDTTELLSLFHLQKAKSICKGMKGFGGIQVYCELPPTFAPRLFCS